MDELLDDELLHEFINETREHLYNIETDLLTIEEQGENVDPELVNKVFRAAHSIKGGSGFFGLDKVKELAHRAETVLDMLRAGKMVPNPEITNVLLAAFDRLRDMVNMPGESQDADISDLLVSLTSLASTYLPPGKKEILTHQVVLESATGGAGVVVPQVDIDRSERTGQTLYQVRLDLIHDMERQGVTVLDLYHLLCDNGEVIDCRIDYPAVGTLDDEVGACLPLSLVYSTPLDRSACAALLKVSPERLEPLSSVRENTREADSESVEMVTDGHDASPPLTAVGAKAEGETGTRGKVADTTPRPAEKAPEKAQSSSAGTTDETLRVNVTLLENLMNLAGELVLGRNQLRAAISGNNRQALLKADQQLNQVTSELQDAIMQTRLQPIGHLFGKFPRVVRDMARALGKEIRVELQGKDVELDRSLIEGLSDPLTHMIRNAADHGLETAEERAAAGKPGEGTLTIAASHQAGQVVIEISDDGRGIDAEKIAGSALKKGQVSADKLAGMSSQEKLELIMMPGFSTAERVSEFSGRGVGMDVVKTNLNKLGGQVEINSSVGRGTRFRIKLPLTLAIIPSLIVSLENERFAVPQVNVNELIRVRAEDVKTRIEIVGGTEVLILRDETLPLIRFDRFLGTVPTYLDPQTGRREFDRRQALADRRSPRYAMTGGKTAEAAVDPLPERNEGRRSRPESALEIVIISSNGTRYGLVVGGFHDTEEIVVKPLGKHLEKLREYAGATILGDGSVALIIDAAGLAEAADLTLVSGSQRAVELKQDAERKHLEDQHALLLFHNAADEQCAISLDHVLRIERIRRDQVEMHGLRRTMQYRGASLPLATLADTANVKEIGEEQDLVVIVSRVNDCEIGLLGAMPVDVIEQKAVIDTRTHCQPGISGSAIINGQTIMIADIYELAAAMSSQPPKGDEPQPRSTAVDTGENSLFSRDAEAVTLLLAEDSDFFRTQLQRYLESAGYRVLAAADGQAAWSLLVEHLDQVRLVVTDIEMPRLSGLGLAEKIRADQRTRLLPIIAVSSLAGDDDRALGLAAGVSEYQVKLDRDALLESVARLLD